jgi:hypothetical protein
MIRCTVESEVKSQKEQVSSTKPGLLLHPMHHDQIQIPFHEQKASLVAKIRCLPCGLSDFRDLEHGQHSFVEPVHLAEFGPNSSWTCT